MNAAEYWVFKKPDGEFYVYWCEDYGFITFMMGMESCKCVKHWYTLSDFMAEGFQGEIVRHVGNAFASGNVGSVELWRKR